MPNNPPPTIVTVAKKAGVAISTVSRVLNGGQSSAGARARVEEAIRVLGYTPSPTARNLKLGRTGIVGLVGNSVQEPWFVQLLGGMERVLRQNSASLAIATLDDHGNYDASPVFHWIKNRSVDAFAIVRPGQRELEIANRAEKARIPVAFLLPDIEFDSGLVLHANNLQGGRLAGEHLLSLGHREFAFLGGPADSVDTLDRLRGLREALSASGLELPDHRVRFMPTYELANGEIAASEWLASPDMRRATAIVMGNDALALGFMHRVKREGVRVPEDISVIGFDGIPNGELSHPRLTTVMQPTPTMGEQAASHLLTQRHLPRPPKRSVRYDLELIVRESTGPIAP